MGKIRTKHFTGSYLDEEINDFIDEYPRIRIIDVKYCHTKEVNESSEYSALMLYEVVKTEAELEEEEANREPTEAELAVLIETARQETIGHTIQECAARASGLRHLERKVFVKACMMTFGGFAFAEHFRAYEEEVERLEKELAEDIKLRKKREELRSELLMMSKGRSLEECAARYINITSKLEKEVLAEIMISRFGEQAVSDAFGGEMSKHLVKCIKEVALEVSRENK